MKNLIIGLLVVAIIGLGGWFAYDKTKSSDNSNPTANSGTATPAAEPSNAKVLDMSDKGLTKVGPDIYNNTGVTTLILSNNSLESLPTEMGKMTKLEVLKLDRNRLEGSLIGEIRKMPLISLDVSNNNMTGMPAELGQLNKLVTLDYSNNKITGLPNELANLKNNLKEFNLSGNPLSADKISKLRGDLPNTNIIF